MDGPGMEGPGMDGPGMDEPGMDESSIDELGMDKLGIDEPSIDEPGMDEPGMDKLDMDKLGIDGPGMDKLGIDKLGIDKPGMDKLGTDKLGIDEPAIDGPGLDVAGGAAEPRAGPDHEAGGPRWPQFPEEGTDQPIEPQYGTPPASPQPSHTGLPTLLAYRPESSQPNVHHQVSWGWALPAASFKRFRAENMEPTPFAEPVEEPLHDRFFFCEAVETALAVHTWVARGCAASPHCCILC